MITRDWQYAFQAPMALPDGSVAPGFLQVDRIEHGESVESGSLDKFRSAGYSLPDLPSGVPQGRYLLSAFAPTAPASLFSPAPLGKSEPERAGQTG